MKKVFTLLLAGALCSSMAWGQSYSLDVYDGSGSHAVGSYTQAQWDAVRATNPNAVAVIDYSVDNQTFADGETNIIVKKSKVVMGHAQYSYSCPNLVLTDAAKLADPSKANFYTDFNFTAVSGSYTRDFRGDFNTMCVPFALPKDEFGTDAILEYSSYSESENNACFSPTTSASITPGVAVLVRPAAALTNWTFNFNNTPIVGSPKTGTNLIGVFVTTDQYGLAQGGHGYGVNTDLEGKFSPLADKLYPFRACFLLDKVSPIAPRLVVVEAQSPTQLDEINANQEDVKFFQNGKLMIRHNGQVFDAAGKIVK